MKETIVRVAKPAAGNLAMKKITVRKAGPIRLTSAVISC